MARERQPGAASAPETVISIIGPGMRVVGDVDTDGTVRIEGKLEGTIRAGKAVVIGKEGVVEGTVLTQDAVISGRLNGTLTAQSRLEIQATSRIDGEVHARRIHVEEGAILNGSVSMGERKSSDEAAASDGAPPPEEPPAIPRVAVGEG